MKKIYRFCQTLASNKIAMIRFGMPVNFLKCACVLLLGISLICSGCQSHTISWNDEDVFDFMVFPMKDVFQGLAQISFENEKQSAKKVSLFYEMGYQVPLKREIGHVTQEGKIELNVLGNSLAEKANNLDSSEGHPMFWFYHSESETLGISATQIYKWQKESAFPLLNISGSSQQQILITSDGAPVKSGSHVIFWREEGGVFYYFSGKTDEKGILAYLTKDKTYHACILQNQNDNEFSIAFSELTTGENPTVDFHNWFEYSPTLPEKKITGIFPFKKGIYPFKGNSPLAVHLFFTQTALKFYHEILCIFYEGDTEFDMAGKAGVLLVTPDKINAKMKEGIPTEDGAMYFFGGVEFESEEAWKKRTKIQSEKTDS